MDCCWENWHACRHVDPYLFLCAGMLFIVTVVALLDLRHDNDDRTFLTLSAQFAV
jgi:hypothetical protein